MLTKVKNVNLLCGMEFYCYLCGRKNNKKTKNAPIFTDKRIY